MSDPIVSHHAADSSAAGDSAARNRSLNRRPHVVIVGAGFAGLWAAQGLSGEDVDITLLDKHNYHTFFPLLYQVAAAELGPSDIAYPVRSMLRRADGVRFRMAEVTGLDTAKKQVQTSIGALDYDALILALGSVPAYFGVEGAEEFAYPLRVMDDALPLRREVLSRFEVASHEHDPAKREQLLTFVIVGGGPTGVEFAGALSELIHGPLMRDYPGIARDEVQIVLVEGQDRVLGGMKPRLSRYAEKRLGSRNVDVRLNTFVKRIHPHGVELADGSQIASETVVWTAGIQGDPIVRQWGLPTGSLGRVEVEETLQVKGHPEIWVGGDLARSIGDDGEPLPQVAPVAVQQGNHLAEAVGAWLRGEAPPAFRYKDPGMLAVVGRSHAVAQVFGTTMTGVIAWILWAVVHVAKLVGFRNRMLVLVNWAWNYLFHERSVRLILPVEKSRIKHDVETSGLEEPAG